MRARCGTENAECRKRGDVATGTCGRDTKGMADVLDAAFERADLIRHCTHWLLIALSSQGTLVGSCGRAEDHRTGDTGIQSTVVHNMCVSCVVSV